MGPHNEVSRACPKSGEVRRAKAAIDMVEEEVERKLALNLLHSLRPTISIRPV
jgi:hypothetical protein